MQFISSTENQFHVKTHVIKADFSQGQEIYPKISDQLAGKEIGILGKNIFFHKYFSFAIKEKLISNYVLNLQQRTYYCCQKKGSI